MKSRLFFTTALVLVAMLTVLAAPSSAKKKGFKTGTYTASGDIAFKFTIKKAACSTYGGGAPKQGYCFSGFGDPKHAMDCPEGSGMQPDYSDYVTFPYNVRIPSSGRLSVTMYSYFSQDVIAGTTWFNIKLGRNGKASGSVKKDAVTTWGTPATCTTGELKFTAKRTGK